MTLLLTQPRSRPGQALNPSLKFLNCKDRKLQSKIESLVKFCLTRFLTARKINALAITIAFLPQASTGGGCAPLDLEYRSYGIDLATFNDREQEFYTERDLSIILCHELVHIKQWALGEKFEYADGKRTRWQGNDYSVDLEYWAQPWEHEAYGLERALYELWLLEQK